MKPSQVRRREDLEIGSKHAFIPRAIRRCMQGWKERAECEENARSSGGKTEAE